MSKDQEKEDLKRIINDNESLADSDRFSEGISIMSGEATAIDEAYNDDYAHADEQPYPRYPNS
jgi:hypothetical protein